MVSIKRDRLFWQYLLSYLCIFFIPFTVFFTVTYGSVRGQITDRVVKENKQGLLRAKAVIEIQLEYLDNAKEYLCYNAIFPNFNFETNTMRAIDIQEKLKAGLLLTPFVYDIIYFQGESDYVLGSKSSGTVSSYVNDMYHYLDMDEEWVEYTLRHIEEDTFWKVQDVKPIWQGTVRLMTYIMPVKTIDQKDSNNQFVFFLPQTLFDSALQEAYIEGGVSYILDRNGEVLVIHGEDELVEYAMMGQEREKILSAEESKIRVGNGYYRANCVESEQYGWKYVSLIPESEMVMNVRRMWIPMFALVLLFAGISAVFIFFFMKKNFLPIYRLKEYAGEVDVETRGEKSGVDGIKQTLQWMVLQNEKLQKSIQDGETELRHIFIRDLLWGKEMEPFSKKKQAELYEIRMNCERWQCAVIHFPSKSVMQIQKMLEHVAPKSSYVWTYSDGIHGNLYFMVGYRAGKEQYVQGYWRQILETAKVHEEKAVWMGVGRSYEKIEEVPKSRFEAEKALELHLVGKEEMIYLYEDREKRKKAIYLEFSQLEMAVFHKNEEKIGEILQHSQSQLEDTDLSVESVQENCKKLIFSLGKLANRLNKEIFEENRIDLEAIRNISYATVSELFEQTMGLCRCILEWMEEENKRADTMQQILDYIGKKVWCYDLTVSNIAEQFHMSPSYLSQYFKAKQGITVLDYITNLKMETARDLLLTTSFTVAQIAEKIGYANEKTFTRRFKQMMGVTPGEYRKKEK